MYRSHGWNGCGASPIRSIDLLIAHLEHRAKKGLRLYQSQVACSTSDTEQLLVQWVAKMCSRVCLQRIMRRHRVYGFPKHLLGMSTESLTTYDLPWNTLSGVHKQVSEACQPKENWTLSRCWTASISWESRVWSSTLGCFKAPQKRMAGVSSKTKQR